MQTSTQERQTWTILSLIEWGAEYLAQRQFDDARLNIELLLCHVLQCRRIDLYLKFDAILSPDHLATFKSLFKRRLNHEPLQYILGETEFMGMRFRVDPRVLIPRPETEILVENVISFVESSRIAGAQILDVGTGSGNIAVSLAKRLPDCIVTAIDISTEALDVARENAQHHCVQDRVHLLDIDFLQDTSVLGSNRFHILAANPPYISLEEFAVLQPEVRDFEPLHATTDNHDGLTFYRRIAGVGIALLKEKGMIFMEIAYNQGQTVPALFTQSGYSSVDVTKDYSGNNRVVKVRVGDA